MSSRVCFWSAFIAFWFLILAGLTPKFGSFICFYAVGVGILVTSVAVLFVGIMASVPDHMRGQAMAMGTLGSHLGGDIVAPYILGVLV